MKTKLKQMHVLERLTVLTFDEIHILNRICIDTKKQQKIGPHKCCQAVTARGIVGNWKEPVFYKFDQKMTKHLITEILTKLYNAGFIDVTITTDMGTGNLELWSELVIGHNKNSFFNHYKFSSLRMYRILRWENCR